MFTPKYPFHHMQVGETVDFPMESMHLPRPLRPDVYRRIMACLRNYRKRHPDMDWKINKREAEGIVRVTRTA
jgi:hypothetical protein